MVIASIMGKVWREIIVIASGQGIGGRLVIASMGKVTL
jgi:hypothetical protein